MVLFILITPVHLIDWRKSRWQEHFYHDRVFYVGIGYLNPLPVVKLRLFNLANRSYRTHYAGIICQPHVVALPPCLSSYVYQRIFKFVFIGGIGSAIGTLAFTEAFHYLNPTIVILLQKLQPIVAILLAYWLLKEHIEGHFLQWAAVILLGSFVMMWPDLRALGNAQWHYSSDTISLFKGYGYTLIAVIAWGATTVCGKYLSHQHIPANAIMSGRFFAGLLVLLPIALAHSDELSMMTSIDLSLIVVMALLSGFIGMWFYYQGLKTIPAQLATLAELSFPAFAALINWVFLDMGLTGYQIIGGMMLILGNIGLRMKNPRRNDLSPVMQ